MIDLNSINKKIEELEQELSDSKDMITISRIIFEGKKIERYFGSEKKITEFMQIMN